MDLRWPSQSIPGTGWWAWAVFLVLTVSTARADLHFPQPEADAGEVRSGSPLSHRFSFTNRGPGPVEILSAQASCGCLEPRLDRRTLQPGEQGVLLLDVNTLTQPAGSHRWGVRVRYRCEGELREARLTLAARVVREIVVQPAALTVFTDSSLTHEIVLADTRPQSLNVTAVRTTSPWLQHRLDGPRRDEHGRPGYRLYVQVAAECPEGRHDEIVHIYTDDPAYPDLKVPITVVKRPRQRFTATPDAVTLLAPRGQAAPSRIVLIRDRENGRVVVDRVEADDPAVICRWAEGPNNLATVKVTVDRNRVRGDHLHGAVHVHLSEPARETLTIRVTCLLD